MPPMALCVFFMAGKPHAAESAGAHICLQVLSLKCFQCVPGTADALLPLSWYFSVWGAWIILKGAGSPLAVSLGLPFPHSSRPQYSYPEKGCGLLWDSGEPCPGCEVCDTSRHQQPFPAGPREPLRTDPYGD